MLVTLSVSDSEVCMRLSSIRFNTDFNLCIEYWTLLLVTSCEHTHTQKSLFKQQITVYKTTEKNNSKWYAERYKNIFNNEIKWILLTHTHAIPMRFYILFWANSLTKLKLYLVVWITSLLCTPNMPYRFQTSTYLRWLTLNFLLHTEPWIS